MRRINNKQRKKLYSLSSLLFHLLAFIVLLISLGTDSNENTTVKDTNAIQENTAIAKKESSVPFKTLFTSIKN